MTDRYVLDADTCDVDFDPSTARLVLRAAASDGKELELRLPLSTITGLVGRSLAVCAEAAHQREGAGTPRQAHPELAITHPLRLSLLRGEGEHSGREVLVIDYGLAAIAAGFSADAIRDLLSKANH